MTSTFTRPALALTLALALAGCGGGKASFTVSGGVAGLAYNGLVLTTNGMDVAVPANSTTFQFANSLSYGDVYNVLPKTQPQHETCTVGSYTDPSGHMFQAGSDTAGRLAAIDIGVVCTLNSAAIGGTITGLTSDGLTLTNGSSGGTIAPVAGTTTFTLPVVTFNTSYGVTVLTQPANDVCSVSPNGTGIMGDDPVTDIAVTCVPK